MSATARQRSATRFRVETIVVRKYKSGPNEGSFRPFSVPAGGTIIGTRYIFESMLVDVAVRVAG